MSIVTDTTNHKNEVGVVVLGWQTTRGWIPAYAGMTVGVVGRLFSEESLMSIVTDTTNHENGVGDGNGQPQGLPLREVGRGLFSEESLMQACGLHIEG